jgi:hypothetical protein
MRTADMITVASTSFLKRGERKPTLWLASDCLVQNDWNETVSVLPTLCPLASLAHCFLGSLLLLLSYERADSIAARKKH